MHFIDAKNVFLIGGAAAVVLAGAYVIWGPSERKRNKGSRRGNVNTVEIPHRPHRRHRPPVWSFRVML